MQLSLSFFFIFDVQPQHPGWEALSYCDKLTTG